MTSRVHNFGAGPAALPLAVLQQVREELLDFDGTGMSILESSHRGPAYSRVHEQATEDLRTLLGGAPNHDILFMSGGARTQFSAVPMNLLSEGERADYLVTGRWSELAVEAAAKVGTAREIWSSKETTFDRVAGGEELRVEPGAAYLHYTSNNTIYGTQYRELPDGGETPLVCDMSSDILSEPLDVDRFGVIYAGAQKNLGCAGVTLVIVRRDLLERSPDSLPDTLSYARMAAKSSLLNTPPVFPIYVLGLVMRWLLAQGGLPTVAERNRKKAETLYSVIDRSGGFYQGHARAASRSRMNVTFRLPNEALEKELIARAAKAGLVGLKGHRSVGGARASIYNAATSQAVAALAEFMRDFQLERG